MITMGYDIGTRFIKACIVKDGQIIGASCVQPLNDMDKALKQASKEARKTAGLWSWQIDKTAATGFGAEFAKTAAFAVTPAPCLARAAFHVDKDVRTVVDVGALFINIVCIDQNGFVEDSGENERCAAGSGKFLETVANAVEIPLPSISDYAFKAKKPYPLTSSCAVFAESEVISQVNSGIDNCEIIAGVIASIASKVSTMCSRLNAKDKIALVGGVSKIDAFKVMLENELGRDIIKLPVDSQITAAYGAALLLSGDFKKRRKASGGAYV